MADTSLSNIVNGDIDTERIKLTGNRSEELVHFYAGTKEVYPIFSAEEQKEG